MRRSLYKVERPRSRDSPYLFVSIDISWSCFSSLEFSCCLRGANKTTIDVLLAVIVVREVTLVNSFHFYYLKLHALLLLLFVLLLVFLEHILDTWGVLLFFLSISPGCFIIWKVSLVSLLGIIVVSHSCTDGANITLNHWWFDWLSTTFKSVSSCWALIVIRYLVLAFELFPLSK